MLLAKIINEHTESYFCLLSYSQGVTTASCFDTAVFALTQPQRDCVRKGSNACKANVQTNKKRATLKHKANSKVLFRKWMCLFYCFYTVFFNLNITTKQCVKMLCLPHLQRENMWCIVWDYTSLFNWFSILVWETLIKREEDYERGWQSNVCQLISREFLNKLSTQSLFLSQTYRHRNTCEHAHNHKYTNDWPLVLPRHLLQQSSASCCRKAKVTHPRT